MPSCTIRRSSFGGARSSSVANDLVQCSSREGEVVAVGVDVERWKVGDCVCCNFVLEHVCGDLKQEIKASDLGGDTDGVLRKYINSIIRIPDLLSYEEASTLPCATLTAMKRGDSVLALRNRRFSAQIALASGANVIVTFSSDEKLEIAKKMGAWHRINRKKMPNWDEEITGGRRITGGSNTLQQSSGAVKDSGCVHIISFVSGGKQEIPDMNRLFTARNPNPVVESLLFPTSHRRVYLESQKHVGEVVTRVSKD
ncbi:NAD(P)-binding protein [Pisolithus tinctorius]|nr:NAD(P)-binding protein [Pisolithus tinctorius]